jgi:hypothetical protein
VKVSGRILVRIFSSNTAVGTDENHGKPLARPFDPGPIFETDSLYTSHTMKDPSTKQGASDATNQNI